MESHDEEWVSLEILLFMEDGPSIGGLASAIELHGIWGVDRYGRFKCFAPASAQAEEALDALAQQYAFLSEEHLRGVVQGEPPRSPLELAHEFNAFSRYGWLAEQLPDFASVVAAEPAVPLSLGQLPGGRVKGANADLRVIGALYAFIKGEDGAQRHPDFTTQAALVDKLAGRYQGASGLSKANLEKKLPLAKRALDDALAAPSANTP